MPEEEKKEPKSDIEKAASTIVKYKVMVGVLLGLLAGAFAAGLAFKQQFEDAMKSYGALQALQQNKWGPNPGDSKMLNSNVAGSNAICPDGSYMVGITNPSQGILISHCRQLNLSALPKNP